MDWLIKLADKICSLCGKEAIVHCDVDGYYFCRKHVKIHDSIQMMHLHAKMKDLAIDMLKKSKEYEEIGTVMKDG